MKSSQRLLCSTFITTILLLAMPAITLSSQNPFETRKLNSYIGKWGNSKAKTILFLYPAGKNGMQGIITRDKASLTIKANFAQGALDGRMFKGTQSFPIAIVNDGKKVHVTSGSWKATLYRYKERTFAGQYKKDTFEIELQKTAEGKYIGGIKMNGAVYIIDAQSKFSLLWGRFSKDTQSWPFFAHWTGDERLDFHTGNHIERAISYETPKLQRIAAQKEAEQKRLTAERKRMEAKKKRIAAEKKRIAAEKKRKAAERKAALKNQKGYLAEIKAARENLHQSKAVFEESLNEFKTFMEFISDENFKFKRSIDPKHSRFSSNFFVSQEAGYPYKIKIKAAYDYPPNKRASTDIVNSVTVNLSDPGWLAFKVDRKIEIGGEVLIKFAQDIVEHQTIKYIWLPTFKMTKRQDSILRQTTSTDFHIRLPDRYDIVAKATEIESHLKKLHHQVQKLEKLKRSFGDRIDKYRAIFGEDPKI